MSWKKLSSLVTLGFFLFSSYTQVFALVGSVNYSTTSPTSGSVIAELTGDYDTFTGTNPYTFTNNGIYVWEISSGGVEFDVVTGEVTWIDTILPTFTGVDSGALYSGAVSIHFSDNIAIDTALLNGSPYVSGTPISSDGNYTFLVTDTAGNSTGTSFSLDFTPPTASVSYSTVSVTSGSVVVTLTGYSESMTVNTTGYTFTGNGSFLFTYTDLVGNTGSTLATVSWIDTTSPTFSGVTTGALYSGAVIINFSDNTAVDTALLNGSPYVSGTPISSDGSYSFVVTDTAGNSTGASFTLDVTPPTTSISYTPSSATSGSVIAKLTGYSESLTGINATGYTFSGNGTFLFTYKDLAGNTGTNLATVTWIDKTQPTFSGVSSGALYSGSVSINFSDNISASAVLNGVSYISGTPISAENNYIFLATDTAGNSTGATFRLDLTPPTTNITYTITGLTNQSVIAKLTGYSETLTGINATGYTFTGNGTFLFTYKDLAGNLGSNLATVTWIDKSQPLITVSSITSSNSTNTGYAKLADTITVLFSSDKTLAQIPSLVISGGSLTTGTVTSLGSNNYSANYVMKATDIESQIAFLITGVIDLYGNTTGKNTTSTIIYDKTVPAGMSITSPTASSYRTSGQSYTITRNTGSETHFGPQSIRIDYSINNFLGYTTLDNGTGNKGSYIWNNFNVTSSNVWLRLITTDLAGNSTTITMASPFISDSTTPVAGDITWPVGGEYLKGGSGYLVTWTGGGDLNLASKTLERSTNGGTSYTTLSTLGISAFSYLWTPTAGTNNTNIRLRLTYTDFAGLQNTKQIAGVFTVDSTTPTITNIISGTIYTGTVTPTITDNYGLSGMTVSKSGGSTTTYFTTGFSITGDGIYTLTVNDLAGNSTGRVFSIDTTAPSISFPSSSITSNTGVLLSPLFTDAIAGLSGYQRSKLSGTGTVNFSSGTGPSTLVLSSGNIDGTYVIQVQASDKVNNIATGNVTINWDFTKPILSGNSSVSVINTTASYKFSSTETGTIYYSGACGTGSLSTAQATGNTLSRTLANATYSNCSLWVVDGVGNASTGLSIPSFTVNYTAPVASAGGGGGGGGSITPAKTKDSCIDGDYSGDPYDGLCKDPTKIEAALLKTGSTTTGILNTATTTTSNSALSELTTAYLYSYQKGITTIASVKGANLTGNITKAQLAKMISEYAIKVVGKKLDTTKKCNFTDTADQPKDLQTYAQKACQLGLMGLASNGSPSTQFKPNDPVSRAIFATTLSRTIWGTDNNQSGTGNARYIGHLTALKNNGIIQSLDMPNNWELRGYVMLMLMRADQKIITKLKTTSTTTNITGASNTSTANTNTTTNTISINTGALLNSWTTSEQTFISSMKKTYQFSIGYTKGTADVGIKYLQYFLKIKGFYAGTINGTNTVDTISAVLAWQKVNNLITDDKDPAAGYLGPKSRELLNQELTKLLN